MFFVLHKFFHVNFLLKIVEELKKGHAAAPEHMFNYFSLSSVSTLNFVCLFLFFSVSTCF